MRLVLIALFLPQAAQESEPAKKARADLAGIRASIEKLVKVREKLQKIDEQLREGAEDPDRPRKLAEQRQQAIQEFQDLRGGAVRAMDALVASSTEELKKAPEDAGLLDVRSEAFLLYNREDDALADLEKLAALRPDDADLALKTGRIEQKLNRYDAAVASLQRYLKKDPAHVETRTLLAMSYFAVHRFDEANALFDHVLKEKLDPQQEQMARQFQKMAAAYSDLWMRERETRAKEEKAGDLPRVVLSTSKGDIEVELFENEAPNTVANFIELVSKRFYDGQKFHRVIPGFMAQGGCPRGDGSGDAGYRFRDEVAGAYRRHFRGTLSMANSGPDTNGSQFFLTHLPTEWLNGKHTVFGRVLKGQEVVDRLRAGDELRKAEVTRARDHAYSVRKLGDEKPPEKKEGGKKDR